MSWNASSAKVAQARLAADRLAALGEHKHAEAVRSLCRSNSSLRKTCAELSKLVWAASK
jgi:hypothetical protein